MTAPEARTRADRLLVSRGFFDSRSRAREAVEAGLVSADGVLVGRPSDLLRETAEIRASGPHPWVSRGGVKLAAALDAFGIDPAGRDCLDVGASTGGFTEVLLNRGAARVEAVDVGHGQLHPKLAADPRVVSLEGLDARRLRGVIAPESADLITIDVSFISLRLVVPELTFALRSSGQVVALIKPQFEVGRSGIGRGGIVRDAVARDAAVAGIVDLVPAWDLDLLGLVPSPIDGRDGNCEYLIGARRA